MSDSPYNSATIREWPPSEWPSTLNNLLAYYNDAIGSGTVNIPVVANNAARDALTATAGALVYVVDGDGAGNPTLCINDGADWQQVWPAVQPLPTVADNAARDALSVRAGSVVYVVDGDGAGNPALDVYDGARWQTVWPSAAPAAVVVPTSLSSLWVDEPGVLGGDTPFVLAAWQDAATTGPNVCGATALALTLQRGCIRAELTPGAARFGAFGLPIPTLADGDEVCFRFLADFQLAAFDSITSSVSGTVFAGFFETGGADTKWVGAGYLSAATRIAAPTWGRWANTGPAPNISSAANLGADSQSGAAAFQTRVFDVRARRVGAATRLYYAIDGGAWMTADGSTVAATVNLASGTVRAGIRVATTSATATSAVVTLVAFGHFVGGLPAAIARG